MKRANSGSSTCGSRTRAPVTSCGRSWPSGSRARATAGARRFGSGRWSSTGGRAAREDRMAEAPRWPGIPATADGSEAVVWVETQVSQGACAYPITSSTNMGAGYQAAQAAGKKNLWGEPLFFLELESEHSSASTCEGFAVGGGRVTNFTSGQGLVLMKEVLYTIAGKRLPVVFQVGARALTSQALNVHCGHDDVMAVADTGWGIAFARNCQEVADLAVILRRVAEEAETPFLCVQDGFLTTHTVENVRLPEPALMAEFVGDPYAVTRLRNLMNPAKPIMSGVVQNQDAYMKGKVAQRFFIERLPGIARDAMDRYGTLTGRRYAPVDGYRLDDAEFAIVGLGSMMETAMATADWLRAHRGLRVGVLSLTLYRPFPAPGGGAGGARGRAPRGGGGGGGGTSCSASRTTRRCREARTRTSGPPGRSRCAATRSAASARSRPTTGSRRPPAAPSAWSFQPSPRRPPA